MKVDGLTYHGRLRLVPRGQERFDLINDLGIENYVKGVLARELLPKWDVQTYEAQAVVARTYAIYETKAANSSADFDVFADQRSQMYGGIAAESAKAKAAVDATAGTVVVAGPAGQEHIFKAYFCSCCGGIGQSAADAFGDEPSPELSEQSNGMLCCAAPFFTWGPIDISKAELTRRFRRFAQLHNRPDVMSATVAKIDIFSSNTLGRPVRFVATTTSGQRIFLSGEELRWAVNTDATDTTRLKSSLVKIVNTPKSIRFTGHGYGHGVGMCQWTAQKRAEMGMPYDQIVTLAFPTSKLVKAY